jgi:hypothetical protein
MLGHCPAIHIIKDKTVPNKFITARLFHETEDPYKGHWRHQLGCFYNYEEGEKYSTQNDGLFRNSPPEEKKGVIAEEVTKALMQKPESENSSLQS